MTPAETLDLVDGLIARGVPAVDAARTAAEIARGGPQDRLLSAEELAAVTGRSVRTVQRWLADGTVPVVKAAGQAVGVHFPTFLAVCTEYAQPGRGAVIRAGEIAANLARRTAA